LLNSILFLFSAEPAIANTISSSSGSPVIHFSIKPRLCVLNTTEESCRDELEITWRAAEKISLCLHQVDKTDPLRCWQNEKEGVYRFEIVASETTEFQLRDINSDISMGAQQFEVVYNDKKYRRARRNPWSFF
jgi:hypothetical protein